MTSSMTATRRVSGDVLWVGAGIGVYGLSSFAFLAIAAQTMGLGAPYTALALMWTLLNAIGIGLYLPVEQESGRSIVSRRSLGHPTASALRVPLRYAGSSLLVIALVVALANTWFTDEVFDGQSGMTWVFVVALAGMALAYQARGVLAGTGRFPRYGLQLGVDGALRVAGAVFLAVRGLDGALWFGAVLALSPFVATAVTLIKAGPLLTRGPGFRSTTVMTPLVLASITSQALANAGPVAAQLLKGPGEEAAAANLVNALTVARIPLFLFAAVQAVFLPRLARYVAHDERGGYVGALRTATLLTAVIGALGVAAAALVGPQVVQLLFGHDFAIGRGDIVLLGASAALFMNTQVLVQGLLARSRDLAAAASWSVGLLALVAALAIPLELTPRVALALTIGSAAALVAAAVALRQTLHRWSEAS